MMYLYRKWATLASDEVAQVRQFGGRAVRQHRNFIPGRRMIAGLLSIYLFCIAGAAQIRDRTQKQTPPGTDANQSQVNAKPKKRGPRAIAVVEFLPGGGTRLVPIALWIDDRFYDASLYGANPEPMALEPETVYEATNYGEPTGLFTVTTPEQVKGNWVATGQWRPQSAMDQKLAEQAAKQAKTKPKETYSPDQDRPVLRRPGSSESSDSTASSGSGSTSPSSGNSEPSSNEPPDRPTLKKPASESSGSSSSSDQSTTPAAQPTTAGNASAAALGASPDEGDPNRPVLRRGQPQQKAAKAQVPSEITQSTAAVQEATAKISTTLAQLQRRSYPAVSDAGPYEPRSLLYVMNESERSQKSEQLQTLAMNEIRKFIAGRKAPALPKTASITNFDLRSYDLEYSNSPTLVFTGALPVAGAKAAGGGDFSYFVTVVAREDVDGTPIKIFSSVTDSNHLDAYPRLEIIDAVDADANGRGDLLFRQYSDTGINYSLYRVYPYDMRKIFEGGSSM